jgi:hypothetical protein
MRFFVAVGIGFAAAAPAPAADDAGACLWANQVDGFGTATRGSIVLMAGTRNWLATFPNPCIDAEEALSVALDARGTCVGNGDQVVFKLAGGMSQHCTISSVTPVDRPAGK